MNNISNNIYITGDYLLNNPSWHVKDSEWKAQQIIRILKHNNLQPKTICEVGCGAGEILLNLQRQMNKDCEFYGYEISPQAFSFCKTKTNEKLNFILKDILHDKAVFYELILLIDIVEHLENPFAFLRDLKSKSDYKIVHIPLDLSLQSLIRVEPILYHRKMVGHIQYFTKELALQLMADTGYKVLDYFYTAPFRQIPAKTIKSFFARLPRRLLFFFNQDIAVRILGGYSLIILMR